MRIRPGDPVATRRQIDGLVRGVRSILGPSIVGMYEHGSAVLGGLRPDSDIDVLVVESSETTSEQKRALVDLLLNVSVPPGPHATGRPIELDLVIDSEIRPWRYPPRFEFHYSELLRDRFETGDLEPWAITTNRDLASIITMVLLGDEPLLGPPPAEVLDVVPRDDYVDAVLRDIDTVDEYLDWDTRNVVLTLPRIWTAIATEEVHSKESAARWALPLIPQEHRAVLDRALSAYLGETEDSWDDVRDETRAYVDAVLKEIQRARAEH
jgi:predicted nucleotidyltransferase